MLAIEQPGHVKGAEVRDVLARDVAAYRSCMEGKVCIMGKTLMNSYLVSHELILDQFGKKLL